MKALKFRFIFLVLATSVMAQNFQVHYDLGEDREYVTTTLEMFKPDEYGATFWFVDFDYNNAGNKSLNLTYWEIARYVTLPIGDKKLSATVQYNDGTAPWGPLGHVWLGGVSYPINLKFITLNTDILYRKSYLSDGSDWQLTFVWFKPFVDGKLHFTGFCDVWSQDFGGDKKTVVLTEPQLWWNFGDHLAAGGEVEISKRFLPTDEWEINPTLALKWNF